MQFPDSDFWNFSVIFYQQPDVEQACLVLQDKFNLNVNLILFCHWLAIEQQHCLTENQWQQLNDAALPLDGIIKSLRESRRMIKNSAIAWPTDFKQETSKGISNVELNTEHMQQLAIEQAWQQIQPTPSDQSREAIINENFRHYLLAISSDDSAEAMSNETNILLDACLHFQEKSQTMAL